MTPTKVTEVRQPTGVDRRTDPHCRTCQLEPPRDTMPADKLWAWTLRQPAPTRAFRHRPS